MKYFCKIVLYIILFAVFLAACASLNESENDQQGTETQDGVSYNTDNVNGNETDMQSSYFTGGVSLDAENINLKDLSVIQRQGETFITFSFLSGSRNLGYPEKKLTQVPMYEVSVLGQPSRIKIKFHNISFWDYEIADTSFPDYVFGIFREVPAKDDSLEIYIQLKKNVLIAPSEEEGSLTLKLTPSDLSDDIKYYCIANAFLEHQEGRWPDSLDMQPVLCADLLNKLLISKPFDTRDEAYAYMQNASEILANYLPEKTLNVVALSEGDLPEYSIDIDYSLLENRPVVQKDGAVVKTPLLLNNGRYLCSSADGRIAFARSQYSDKQELNLGYVYSDTLWIRYQNDRIQCVDVPEFFSIEKAAFSSDGRYLAILDSCVENSVLYVYDFESSALYNLGEEGFGSLTADFAWSDTDNTILYAASTDPDAKIMSCLFSNGSKTINESKGWLPGEGRLAVSQGRIFFAQNEKVYLLSDKYNEVAKGTDISVSPDGKKLLILKKEASKGEQVLTSLKLYDIETREETVIVSNADITSFGFSQSGGKIYYTTVSDESEEFSFALFVYDTQSGNLVKDSLCKTALFYPAAAPATLYFVDYIDDNIGNGFYATYIYDLSA